MDKKQTHYYLVDGTRRFENKRDICMHIGISSNVFRRLMQHGYIKKYNINTPANSSKNQRVEYGNKERV